MAQTMPLLPPPAATAPAEAADAPASFGQPATTGRTIYPLIPSQTPVEVFIEQWLHGRPRRTQEAYRRDAYRFLFSLPEEQPFHHILLADLQAFADSLAASLAPASRARVLKAIKSMFTFAQNTGYLPFNVGVAIRLPKVPRRLAERILSEEQIHSIIGREEHPRNHALLRFLYISGARVSEACQLTWRDLQARENGMGQVTFIGKGTKARTVLLPASLYQELLALRAGATAQDGELPQGEDEPVFASRGGRRYRGSGHLDTSQVHRIVEQAAVRAGVLTYMGTQKRGGREQPVKKSRVSPHFFRHAHASHALDRGVPPHVVQQTLGHASLTTTSDYSHARPGTSSALAFS